MKLQIQIMCGALFIGALAARANTIPSPDGQYHVTTGRTVEVTDVTGQPVLELVRDTNGAKRIEVAWSPDSMRLVVVEDYARGSGVFAAWHAGSTWHKSIEDDDHDDGAAFTQLVE